MNKYISTLLLFFITIIISGCLEEPTPNDSDWPEEVEGMRPLYANGNYSQLSVSDPLPVKNLGKIYYKSPYIYVIEKGLGFHIIDNSTPSVPEPKKFVYLSGCNDIAIKGDILYADNFTDLLSIDIGDLNSIKIVNRIEGLYPAPLNFPEGYNGYFECVDESKGMVRGWELTTLNYPECRR